MMALYFLSQREKACEALGRSASATALLHFLVDEGVSDPGDSQRAGSFLALQTLNNLAFCVRNRRLLLLSDEFRLIERIEARLAVDDNHAETPRRHLLERTLRILGHDAIAGPHRSLPAAKRRRVRVLSLDGGGTRGLVSIAVLQQLERRLNGGALPDAPGYRRIHEFFDLVCGTSTGGIIAFAIGIVQMPLEDVDALYRRLSAEVFSGDVRKLVMSGTMHDTKRLEAVFRELAGDALELIDTTASRERVPRCFVAATRTTEYPSRPFLFRNYQHDIVHNAASHYDGSARFKVWQALRATSAAPIYLEPFRDAGETFADGGLLVNNPSAVAIHEANRIFGNGSVSVLLSIGTGNETPPASDKSATDGADKDDDDNDDDDDDNDGGDDDVARDKKGGGSDSDAGETQNKAKKAKVMESAGKLVDQTHARVGKALAAATAAAKAGESGTPVDDGGVPSALRDADHFASLLDPSSSKSSWSSSSGRA